MKHLLSTVVILSFVFTSSLFSQNNEAKENSKTEYYEVIFGTYFGDGVVEAEVEGVPISSGDTVMEGADITFTAIFESYCILNDWWYNGNLTGITGWQVIEEDLAQDIEVYAEILCYPPPNSIEENNFDKSKISPNPANGVFNIELNQPTNIYIYNSSGACVYKSLNADSDLQIGNLPKGIYFVKLVSESKTITEKLIVE